MRREGRTRRRDVPSARVQLATPHPRVTAAARNWKHESGMAIAALGHRTGTRGGRHRAPTTNHPTPPLESERSAEPRPRGRIWSQLRQFLTIPSCADASPEPGDCDDARRVHAIAP